MTAVIAADGAIPWQQAISVHTPQPLQSDAVSNSSGLPGAPAPTARSVLCGWSGYPSRWRGQSSVQYMHWQQADGTRLSSRSTGAALLAIAGISSGRMSSALVFLVTTAEAGFTILPIAGRRPRRHAPWGPLPPPRAGPRARRS